MPPTFTDAVHAIALARTRRRKARRYRWLALAALTAIGLAALVGLWP